MPIPFDMVAVMLFLGFYVLTPEPNPPAPAISGLILLAAMAALALACALVNRTALLAIGKQAHTPAARRQSAAIGESLVRILLVAAFVIGLTESSFPWSMAACFGASAGNATFIQLAGLIPYCSFFVCAWLPLYRLHREIAPGRWTRRSFLVHKARYNLYILLAWVPFTLFSDWLSGFVAALPILFFVAAWAFPYLLARLWGCTPLPEGELLDSIRRLEKKAGAGFSRVLVWEPGGGSIQNAAAVGVFRPFRYLFLTPALMRNMNRDELEGVILHELGHVKHRHLLFYMFATLAGVNFAVLASEWLPLRTDLESFAVIVALILIYFRFVFGWLSRGMERQADLFALETSGSATGLINALEKLGIGAGNIRMASSWHHLGIAERVAFLRHAEANPRLVKTHNRIVTTRKALGYLLSLAILALTGLTLYDGYQSPRPFNAPERVIETSHWRRVMLLMPANAVGPLELAYRLAADPQSHDEAVELAAKAARLASDKEERAAAEKLIEALSGETP